MELAASLGIPILLGGTDTSCSARYKRKWTLRKVNNACEHTLQHVSMCMSHAYAPYSSTQRECVCAGVFSASAGPA